MIFIDNNHIHDPRVNLAFEEYAIRHLVLEDEILLFYINEPSIIIGRNQNTIEEINVDFVEKHGIKVVRRLSGGGAVYHDLGNLNFSFIAPNSVDNFHNFKKFTQPVIDVLHSMGVEAELSGRNDILLDGKKISGNAQYVAGPRMVSHGTLLWQTDLNVVGEALRPKQAKFESKGIKSVRSRVANITEYMPVNHPDIMEFRQAIIESVFRGGQAREYKLTASDWQGVEKLSRERYQTWDWNYGKSPAFGFRRETQYAGGCVEALLDVDRGIVQNLKFYGDFFGQHDVAELEQLLQGVAYRADAIRERLQSVCVNNYFIHFSPDELVALLY